MKVTGQQPPRTSELTTGKAREAEGKAERMRTAAKEGAAPASNRMSLTLSRIREAIRNTPDVRADRVESVRERIRSGEYKVDAERLAQNIMTESLHEDLEKP
ncbi:MAG TPA: flagellar biosynthesis anti-sigma factor FlgM [bacterium]|nr:flagellar biosynthesis anti-sigma factor FlgM [bacterium]